MDEARWQRLRNQHLPRPSLIFPDRRPWTAIEFQDRADTRYSATATGMVVQPVEMPIRLPYQYSKPHLHAKKINQRWNAPSNGRTMRAGFTEPMATTAVSTTDSQLIIVSSTVNQHNTAVYLAHDRTRRSNSAFVSLIFSKNKDEIVLVRECALKLIEFPTAYTIPNIFVQTLP